MTARMSANIGVQIPPPLATDAATAATAIGPCHYRCGRDILRGDRYARLVPSGRIAHLCCIAQAAETPARRPT